MMRNCQRRLCTISQHLICAVRHKAGTDCLPCIRAEPSVALYDEKVHITVSGLPANQKVTLHSQSVTGGKKKVSFGACGWYVSNSNGEVDVTMDPSLGGTYTDIEPMGLLWSLQPAPGENPHTRMAINFTDRPGIVTLNTYTGHLDLSAIHQSDVYPPILATSQLERWFRSKDVTRVEVEDGNIRGSLFLPPGPGPFPAVIDMFGSSGGLIEYRSALLASRGFVSLSLAFYKYKDLHDNLFDDQKYEYFEEAAKWLASHPKVRSGGIGVIAVSKGAEYALCMGAFSPEVKAVVGINGLNAVSLQDITYKGERLLKGGGFEMKDEMYTEEGLDLREAFLKGGDLIPIWKSSCKYLLLVGLDDMQVDVTGYNTLIAACPEEKRSDIQLVTYPGAGHLLEPPYNPLCKTSVNKGFGLNMFWGGQCKPHAVAQEDSWRRILDFLKTHLPTQ